MYFSGSLKILAQFHIYALVYCIGTGMTQWDGMGREVGGVQDGEHMYTRGGSMSMYGKTITIL